MKKFAALPASIALLALGACVDADDDDAADEAAVVETETVVPVPAPTVTETSTTVIDETDADEEPSVEATIGPEPEATIRSD